MIVDESESKYAGHAAQLTRESVAQGYDVIIAAGGDGTISEVANGLVGSKAALAILPRGTFMNLPRMLGIPLELEDAVATIKKHEVRRIDVGQILKLDGKRPAAAAYFLENVGVGVEAELQHQVKSWESGHWGAILSVIRTIFHYHKDEVQLVIDGKTLSTRASLIAISNAPMTGASLIVAPQAKLNDHQFTISVFSHSRLQLMKYALTMYRTKKAATTHVRRYKGTRVAIKAGKHPRFVHADARYFGHAPAEFILHPRALHVICTDDAPPEDSPLTHKALLNNKK